jgi:acetyl-CoA C-acetyltransferase
MAFAGGPLNNYVLQALSKLVAVLRDDPGSLGLLTAVSGMLTKQGVSLWSTRPPAAGYRSADVSEQTKAMVPVVAVGPARAGRAEVATYTVIYRDGQPSTGVVVAERGDGSRAIATSGDRSTVEGLLNGEWCGAAVDLDGAGGFSPA